MPDYKAYLMRHGEHALQDIVERIERSEGIFTPPHLSLEERWQSLLENAPFKDTEAVNVSAR